MLDVLLQLCLFSAKAIIVVVLLLVLLIGVLALISKGKELSRGRISIKNLNEKYDEIRKDILEQVLSKDLFKKFLKSEKTAHKAKKKTADTGPGKNVFVLNFCGDIKASAVAALREEVTAVLSVAKAHDEVVVRLESPGGMVHAYGLAAAQLARIREKNIPLTICVDKVAASGGYLMACVADKILAAPFAIIGSIGVVIQLPNFHRFLEKKDIDVELLTAGDFKRTLTLFGENTEEGREKLQEEIEDIHGLFKQSILQYRPFLNIEQVATGEHWLALQAIEFKLVDKIMTSDDYLVDLAESGTLFEVTFEMKKSLGSKLSAAAKMMFGREDYSGILLK